MILIPVSIGELFDKITILMIKQNYIFDQDKLDNINIEYEELNLIFSELKLQKDEIFLELLSVNQELWHIEDKIRIKEKNNQFDQDFIQLARNVYFLNDKRANIKKKINMKFGSSIIEEKSYQDYSKKEV